MKISTVIEKMEELCATYQKKDVHLVELYAYLYFDTYNLRLVEYRDVSSLFEDWGKALKEKDSEGSDGRATLLFYFPCGEDKNAKEENQGLAVDVTDVLPSEDDACVLRIEAVHTEEDLRDDLEEY